MTTEYHQIASQKGYILIYPETSRDMNCWDVATTKSLSHSGGGDSETLAKMVQYALKKWNGDPKKVFVSGFSSGGMMTSVMCATYPDIFAGGAVFSGVPHACLKGSKGSSPFSDTAPCTKGGYNKSPNQWGALVRESFPSYSGNYPVISYWHGTSDFIVSYQVFGEALKQWSDIHNVKFAKNVSNSPGRGITKMVYGDGKKLLGYSTDHGGHSPQGYATETLQFWGI
jgi:acetylxylan esterase